jgi:hypothetical protein
MITVYKMTQFLSFFCSSVFCSVLSFGVSTFTSVSVVVGVGEVTGAATVIVAIGGVVTVDAGSEASGVRGAVGV